jgi:hypothetical protein
LLRAKNEAKVAVLLRLEYFMSLNVRGLCRFLIMALAIRICAFFGLPRGAEREIEMFKYLSSLDSMKRGEKQIATLWCFVATDDF